MEGVVDGDGGEVSVVVMVEDVVGGVNGDGRRVGG